MADPVVSDPGKVDATESSQVSQIGELFGDFVPPAKDDAKAAGAEPTAEEVAAQAKVDADAAAATDAAKKEKDGVKPDEKSPEIAALMAQIAALAATVTELKGGKKEPEKPVEKEKETILGLGFFKDKAEYEAAFEKPEVMSEVMGRVATSAVQTILKTMPQVINNTIKAQMEVQTRVSDFFKDNDDLKTHKEFVGYVSNDLSGKNPDWTLAKLFEELPKEVRKRIGLKENVKVKTPAQPAKKGGVRVPGERAEELQPLEKEIADLM